MSSRMKQIAVIAGLFVLLGVTGVVAACCGEAPNYHITVSVVGTPDCDYGHGTGKVSWTMSYYLPPSNHVFVDRYGDGVVQQSSAYANLPHVAGAQEDTLTGTTTWQWQPFTQNPRKVRVQFNADAGLSFEDHSLIVFDCTDRGAKNVAVHNP